MSTKTGQRWRQKYPEKHNAGRRAKRREWTPEQLARNKALQKAWRDDPANREKIQRAKWRDRGLPEPTRPMSDCCECCGGPPVGVGALHLDHDHVTGKFRGWLCHYCNTAIGALGDTYEGVIRALDYLVRAR